MARFLVALFTAVFAGHAQAQDRVDRSTSSTVTDVLPESPNKNGQWDNAPKNVPTQEADDMRVRVEDIVEPPSEYHYAAFGRPDPFVPPMVLEDLGKEEVPIVSPLQKYRLDELTVVGIWQLDSGDRKALILTPQGEGIISKVGDMVGEAKKAGRIASITNESLVVRQYAYTPDGTREFEDQSMRFDASGAFGGGVETIDKGTRSTIPGNTYYSEGDVPAMPENGMPKPQAATNNGVPPQVPVGMLPAPDALNGNTNMQPVNTMQTALPTPPSEVPGG